MQQPRDVLVRFHEIGLKGKNQPMFVRRLVENLERATAGLGVERVWATRMLVRMRLAPEGRLGGGAHTNGDRVRGGEVQHRRPNRTFL